MLNPQAPETRPKSAGAGAEMHPRVCSRAGFFQSRGFDCGRVFAKPAPAPAGAIPNCNFDLRNSAWGWGWGVNVVVAAFLQRAARHGRAFMHRCMDREGGCKNFDRSRSLMQTCSAGVPTRVQPAMHPTPAPCSGVAGLR